MLSRNKLQENTENSKLTDIGISGSTKLQIGAQPFGNLPIFFVEIWFVRTKIGEEKF